MTWRDEFGEHAELWVCDKLRELGFNAQHIGASHEYDILINGSIRAEVKCATKSKSRGNRRNRWQFSFRRHDGLNDEELVFLVCYDGDLNTPVGTFVIPGDEVDAKLKKIDITSGLDAYKGKWSTYLEAWRLVPTIVSAHADDEPPLLSRDTERDPVPF